MNDAPMKSLRRMFDTYSRQVLIVLAAATLRVVFDSFGGNKESIETLALPMLTLAVFASIVWIMRFLRAQRSVEALRSKTPHAYVALARRSMPEHRAVGEGALLAGLHGDRDLAERLLASVEWAELPAEDRAHRLFAEAMLHDLDGDADEGLSLARRAAAAADVSEDGETSSRDTLAHRTRVALHRCLVGAPSEATLAALEEGRAGLRDLDRVLASWGLALAYDATGRTEDAERMRAFVTSNVPHARVLRERLAMPASASRD